MPDGSAPTSVPVAAPHPSLIASPPINGGLLQAEVHADPSVHSVPSVMVHALSQALLRPTVAASTAPPATLGEAPPSVTMPLTTTTLTAALTAEVAAEVSSSQSAPAAGWTGQTSLMRCMKSGCTKARRAGGAPYCKSHGGGRRCQISGCTRSAASGGELRCGAHGGGKRCLFTGGCNRMARPGTTADMQFCAAHGGGRRCIEPGCNKSARCGSNEHCAAHGGGVCAVPTLQPKPPYLISYPTPLYLPSTYPPPSALPPFSHARRPALQV